MNTPHIYVKAVLSPKGAGKTGETPVYIRITNNRKRFYKSTGYKAKEGEFSEAELFDKKVPNFQYKNGAIKDMVRLIEKQILEEKDKPEFSDNTIKRIVNGNSTSSGISLEKLCAIVQREYAGNLSEDTLQNYRTVVNKIVSFNKKDVEVDEVTSQFLSRYEASLRKSGQAETTIWSDMKDLRALFNKGRKIKAITHYPFEDYSVPKYKQPKRNYLTQAQVTSLEEYADNSSKPSSLRKAAAWFVFSCYSSMRYGDLAAFEEKTWVRENKLYFSDKKESTPHYIPMYPKLKKAIERIRAFYPIMENQPFNRYLKELQELCGIDIKLTVHVARHTFAVTYLDNGGSKEVLQRLMGHKRMATTEIYGQITDKRIDEEALRVLG